eukprot:scaffold8763_cov119-Isochrysis_galbana.AAC.1
MNDICDICGEQLRAKRVQLDGLTDAQSTRMREFIDEQRAAHDAFHGREHRVYDRSVEHAVTDPSSLTVLTIDAPTRYQFDIPTQTRDSRDTIKKFDGAVRWQSKLEGLPKHKHVATRQGRHKGAGKGTYTSCSEGGGPLRGGLPTPLSGA